MAQNNGQGARERMQRIAQNTMIGRDQGPENFYSTSIALGGLAGGAQTLNIPRTLTLNRPLKSISIELAGRLVIGAYAYSAVAPEHFTNLLSQFQLSGIHRIFGNLVPQRIYGATAFMWPQLFGAGANSLTINGNRALEPSWPFSFNSNQAGSALSFDGSIGTYDFRVQWEIPLGLSFPPSAGAPQRDVSFLYMPQDWTDSLQLQLILGDRSSLGTPQASTTTTWTSYGSATGSPSLTVGLNYSILGAFGNAIKSGVVIRT
jgi:hypothetical protein